MESESEIKDKPRNNIITRKAKGFIISLILLPIILLITILLIMTDFKDLYTSIFIFKDNLTITPEDFPKLSETIYYLICTYTVIVSGIFSYLLYMATKKNIEVTEITIKLSEENVKISNRNLDLQKETTFLAQESNKIAMMMAQRDEDIENENRKVAAFSLYYDLKICFDSIQKTLVEYGIQNTRLTKNRNERDIWILAWKDILRKYTFNPNWRDSLKDISMKIQKSNPAFVEKVYLIYSIFESSNLAIERCNDLHKKIELIPKEQIFNKDFLDKYNDLRLTVSKHDENIEEIEKFKLSLSKLYENEFESSRIKSQINKLEIQCENYSQQIYKFIDYLEDIQKTNIILLNDEWIQILHEIKIISEN